MNIGVIETGDGDEQLTYMHDDEERLEREMSCIPSYADIDVR